MIKQFFITVIIFLFSVNTSASQADSNEILIGTKHKIYSEILDEEREYWVNLPERYSVHANYPVVYVLDARSQFHSVATILRYLSLAGQIPEMILVGITNTDRVRDLTPTNNIINSYGVEFASDRTSGGGENFLKFIMTELSPNVEAEYSVANYRMLIGHSHGGLFSVYSYIMADSFFNSFISVDPSLYWDEETLNKMLQNKQDPQASSERALYISSANNEGDNFLKEDVMVKTQQNFIDTIEGKQFQNLKFKLERFDDENHFTVPWVSYMHGLRFIFENFYLPADKVRENPAVVFSHFENASKVFGYEIPPHEGIVNFAGYQQLQKGNTQEALKYFKINIENFPYSSNVYDSYSDALAAAGETEEAIKNLQKAIELNPDATASKNKLEELVEQQ